MDLLFAVGVRLESWSCFDLACFRNIRTGFGQGVLRDSPKGGPTRRSNVGTADVATTFEDSNRSKGTPVRPFLFRSFIH